MAEDDRNGYYNAIDAMRNDSYLGASMPTLVGELNDSDLVFFENDFLGAIEDYVPVSYVMRNFMYKASN